MVPVLFLLISFCAAAERRVLPAAEPAASGYVVSGDRALSRKVLFRVFKDLSIRDAEALGNHQYLIRLEEDPGLAALLAKAKRAKLRVKIQPNLKYQLEPPAGSPDSRLGP